MESRGELICELEVFSNFHSLVVGICEFYPGLDELWHTAITYRPEPSVCYPQASWQVLGCHCFFPCTSSGTNSRKDILSEQIREALTAHSVASLGGSRFLPEIKKTCRGFYMCHQNPPQKVNSESWWCAGFHMIRDSCKCCLLEMKGTLRASNLTLFRWKRLFKVGRCLFRTIGLATLCSAQL